MRQFTFSRVSMSSGHSLRSVPVRKHMFPKAVAAAVLAASGVEASSNFVTKIGFNSLENDNMWFRMIRDHVVQKILDHVPPTCPYL